VAGVFLVVEGPEGAGKTTLAQHLVQRLRDRGVDVVSVREPGGTPVAEAARRVFLDAALEVSPGAELFLILAARADLVERVIRPALAVGKWVVCDRFELSTEAYQVAGRGLARGAVLNANALATGGLRADLTIVLDVSVEAGRHRQRAEGKQPDRMELAEVELHKRVTSAFASFRGASLVHVDASGTADAVEDAAWRAVVERLGETIGVEAG